MVSIRTASINIETKEITRLQALLKTIVDIMTDDPTGNYAITISREEQEQIQTE